MNANKFLVPKMAVVRGMRAGRWPVQTFLSQGKVLFEHIPIEKQKCSAAEPQPKDDRIGFAACCEDVAVPFRVDALQDLGFALRFEIMAGRSPKSKGALLRKGKAASS